MELWLLGAVVLLGVLVRFPTIGEQSFWYDEAFTHAIVAHGLGRVLSTVPRTESTPPLYYVLLWLWSRGFGTSEAGLRSFSAFCGTLTIPLMWELGRRLVSPRVGIAAALLTAVNPLLFWYSQEARAYALLTFLAALTMLAMLRALERPSPRRLVQWSIVAALALCTHYFAAFVLIPEAIWLAVALQRRRALTVPVLAAGVVPVLAVGAALIPLLAHQNDGRASSLAAGGGSIPYRLAQLVRQDLVGFGQPEKKLVAAAAVLLVVVAGLVLLRRGRRSDWEGVALAAVVGGGGVLLALVVSAGTTDYLETRNLLATWPGLALPLAIGFAAAAAGRVALLALCAVSLACVVAVISDPSLQRPDWRGAARALGPVTSERAIVGDRLAPISLGPYLHGLAAYPAAGASVNEIGVIRATASEAGAQPETMRHPTPPPGFRLARLVRTDSYVVEVYRATAPVAETAGALILLGPVNGQDRAMLQR